MRLPIQMLLLGLITWGFIEPSTAQDTRTHRVSVEDVGTRLILIGRLGKPLGEEFEIRGHWHFPPTPYVKDYSLRFTVDSIDGKLIDKPIEFNYAQLRFLDREHHDVIPAYAEHAKLDGECWTLIGYETGHIQIQPDEYGDPAPVFPVVGMPYFTRPFTSQIVAVLKSKTGQTKD
ncbi:MAG: hypothetical protein IT422_28275 [Pirellulaceae bacterium]|nr:hypothetical protein [Pirellulaceae bacterium]